MCSFRICSFLYRWLFLGFLFLRDEKKILVDIWNSTRLEDLMVTRTFTDQKKKKNLLPLKRWKICVIGFSPSGVGKRSEYLRAVGGCAWSLWWRNRELGGIQSLNHWIWVGIFAIYFCVRRMTDRFKGTKKWRLGLWMSVVSPNGGIKDNQKPRATRSVKS